MRSKISFHSIPAHLAIIMDGNGRWARKRNLERIEGHLRGIKSLRNVIKAAIDFNIKYLTVYAFSSENWRRPQAEVDSLMRLLEEYLKIELPFLVKKRIRLNFIGNIKKIPESSRRELLDVTERTKGFNGLFLTIALSYGSREEISIAASKIHNDIKNKKIGQKDIGEDLFSRYLFTSEIPDPDFLIRTGGEKRLSNFLLYQIAYTEIFFTKTMWPDFGRKELINALRDYEKRIRRFGKTEI